jgi:hypothetical protein
MVTTAAPARARTKRASNHNRRDAALEAALKELRYWERRVGELLAQRRQPKPKPNNGPIRVNWPGHGEAWLDGDQRAAVALLLDAYLEGATPDVPQRALIHAAGGKHKDVADIFAGTGAFGTMVVAGAKPGTYRLPELPEKE